MRISYRPRLENMVGLTFDLCYYCGMTPVKRDKENYLFYFPKSHTQQCFSAWDFMKYFTLTYELFLFYGLVDILSHPSKNFELYMLHTILFSGYLLVSITQISLVLQLEDTMLFYNRCIAFGIKFKEQYMKSDAPTPRWVEVCGWLTILTTLAAFPLSITMSLIFWRAPHLPIFITSILPASETMKYLFVVPVLFFTAGYISLVVLAGSVVLLVFNTVFILRELRKASSIYTDSKLHEPEHCIHVYRCLQLLYIQFNGLMRDYVITTFNAIVIFLVMISNFSIIHLHSVLKPEPLIFSAFTSLVTTFYLLLTYFKLGQVNEMSKAVVGGWQKQPKQKFPKHHNTLLVSKYVNSLRLIQVELGNFGFFSKANSIKFAGKLFVYTSKFVLTAGKFI